MCSMCGLLSDTPHWTDPAARSGLAPMPSLARTRSREHLARLAPLNRVLRPFGMSVSDWGGAYVVQGSSGGQEVVADLGGIWSAAERLAGKRLDPLSAPFLSSVERHPAA